MKTVKILIIVLLLYACGRPDGNQATTQARQNNETVSIEAKTPQTGSELNKPSVQRRPGAKTPDSMLVTAMLPEDIKKYEEAMTAYTNDGGTNPSGGWTFVPVKTHVPYTTDSLKAGARAAAKALTPYADSVVYFRLKDRTAYILLEMDVNGWAGVTYTRQRVRPTVERTLLRSPQVDKVVFNYAPGDQKKR